MTERSEQIINTLEKKLAKVFEKEMSYDNGVAWVAPRNVMPADIFARYKRTGRFVAKDSYIAALCLRLTQAGHPCYPIKDKAEFTGIKSTLKDDEVTEVLFINELIDGDVTKSIKYICEQDSVNRELVFA